MTQKNTGCISEKRNTLVSRHSGIIFRKAESPEDFNKIHRLNHTVFSEEIGQHAQNASGVLVDKFHDKNHYTLAEKEGEIVGMICAHWEPPYSVTDKYPEIVDHLEQSQLTAEIRLLAIAPAFRKTAIAWRLMHHMATDLIQRGVDTVLISGIKQHKRTYEKLGFKAVGEAVKSGQALYYPMIMRKSDFMESSTRLTTGFFGDGNDAGLS